MVALSGLGFRIRCLRFDSCFTASFKGYMLKTRFWDRLQAFRVGGFGCRALGFRALGLRVC